MTQAVQALVGTPQAVSEVMLDWFRRELVDVLSAGEPDVFECRACSRPFIPAEQPQLDADCLFTGVGLPRRACPSCGLIQGPLAIISAPPERLGRLYELIYRFYAEGDTVHAQERSFYLLNPSRAGRYLNYACGLWTRGASRLTDAGWDVWGYEPYITQFHPRISPTVPEGPFDGLFSHNFLEHPQDPRVFLSACHALLKPGGRMAHSTPCYEYLFERSPVHLYFFVGGSVSALCEATGFRVINDVAQDRENLGEYYRCLVFERL